VRLGQQQKINSFDTDGHGQLTDFHGYAQPQTAERASSKEQAQIVFDGVASSSCTPEAVSV
jgi:hypothetical protein